MSSSHPWWSRSSAAPLLLLTLLALGPALLASPALSLTGITDTCLHLIRFCFATLAGFDSFLHAVPWVMVTLGVSLAVARRVAPAWKSARLIRRLPCRAPVPGERIHTLADHHAVLGRTLVLSRGCPNPAFTAGLIMPRIYVAESLQDDLSMAELETVILHEAHHLHRHDPLRYLLAATLADFLFWVPLVRDAIAAVAARIEFAADDAARTIGDLVVASAILRVADISQGHRIEGAVLFVSPQLLERRVERLLGRPGAEREPRPKRITFAVSAAGLLLLWTLGLASSAAHAAHLPHAAETCLHHHEHGVLHASPTHQH